MLPFVEDSQGNTRLGLPQMGADIINSLDRAVAESQGRYDEDGRPIRTQGIDALNVAGIAPLGGIAAGAGQAMGKALAANAPKAASPLALNALEGLPMDQASRLARAREMGFDTDRVLYHGTGKTFDEFSPGTRGNGTQRNVYLTDNPEIADIYANSQNYGLKGGGSPQIYPLYAKAEKPLVVSDKGPDGSFGWVSDNLAAALGVDHPPPGRYSSLYDEARKQGYDQVQIQEMTDLGGLQTQYIPLAPRNIRSVNAAFDPARADSADLLAANPDEAFSAPLALNALEQQSPKGFTAYHGSPHDFDKFSLDAIGTGEGAQAYGHGLYFADSEDVARSYRDALSGMNKGGKHLTTGDSDWYIMEAARNAAPISQKHADLISTNVTEAIKGGFSLDDLRAPLLSQANNDQNFAKALDAAIAEGKSYSKHPGRMYEVNIKADPNDFLDWDKPLSQQSEAVRNWYNGRVAPGLKTKEIGNNPNFGMLTDVLHPEGGSLGVFTQDNLADVLSNPVKYSPTRGEDVVRSGQEAALREAGIPGIRYLDGNSRSAGEGSYNYVIFDADLIEIQRKYANHPNAAAIGAALEAMQQERDQNGGYNLGFSP